jgi:hypothetical protein
MEARMIKGKVHDVEYLGGIANMKDEAGNYVTAADVNALMAIRDAAEEVSTAIEEYKKDSGSRNSLVLGLLHNKLVAILNKLEGGRG